MWISRRCLDCHVIYFLSWFVADNAVSKEKKRVEDVMPIATGHEREELEAALDVIFFFVLLLFLDLGFFLFVWLWWRDDYGFDWLVSFREGTFWMQTILLVRLVQRLVLFAFFRIQPIALTDSRSKSNLLLLILNVWLHIWFLEYYLDGK